MNIPERRRHPRYPLQADVEVQWGSETLSALATDISLGGMFIATNNPLWPGASFAALLMPGEPLSLNCTARRVLPAKGMGILFVDLSDEQRARVAELIQKISE
ncbi:MAG: PilZ domain-containing protein [Acidobacteriales bacterium]|nr:PilZ domain-containing protein [Terriglobales bacterium]